MRGMHPSEERLQQYVLDPGTCPQEETRHIADCPHCQTQIGIYGFVTAELAGQPVPAFDFDLSSLVVGRLQTAGTRDLQDLAPMQEKKGSIAVMGAVIALVIGAPAWLFRRSIYFVFTDMSPAFYWVLLAAGLVIVSLFILRLQRKYQDIINLINK